MNVIHHPCGCLIERLHGFESGHPLYVNALNCEIDNCPQCGEILCDTDLRDADGEWVLIYQQSPWSLARRAAWNTMRTNQ